LVRDRAFEPHHAQFYGASGREIRASLDPQCLSASARTRRPMASDVFLTPIAATSPSSIAPMKLPIARPDQRNKFGAVDEVQRRVHGCFDVYTSTSSHPLLARIKAA